MIQYNAYRFRIYPTQEQEEQLFKTVGCARKTYNELLAMFNSLYDSFTNGDMTKKEHSQARKKIQYSMLKEEFPYLSEVDSLALANAKKDLDNAFSNFFSGKSEKPVFKKRNSSNWSYTTNVVGNNVRLTKHGLKLPKIKTLIKIIVHRNTKGVLKKATITKEKDGSWYVSLLFEQKVKVTIYPETMEEIKNPGAGDLGLKRLITLTTGEFFEGIKSARYYKDKLAKEQKILSRRKDQAKKDGKKLSEAKNYQKQRVKVAKLHSKIRRIRDDYLHKITRFIADLFDFFVLENLNSSGLLKNHCLAFSIQDASWSKFATFLEYKMLRNGGVLVFVDRFFASTQLCSECHEKTGPKGFDDLDVREWECSSCHTVHDRDENAAHNVLFEGLRLFEEFLTTGTVEVFSKPSLVIHELVNQKGTVVPCSQEKDKNKRTNATQS